MVNSGNAASVVKTYLSAVPTLNSRNLPIFLMIKYTKIPKHKQIISEN